MGGKKKGFHLAVVERNRVIFPGDRAGRAKDAQALVRLLESFQPCCVAVDAPRAPAEEGERTRACERAFARAGICRLFWTPSRSAIDANRFYAWMQRGFELYAALAAAGLPAVECFPTASWTVWGGPRRGVARSTWSRRILENLTDGLGLKAPLDELGQDSRDAVGAALTARAHELGRTRCFGDLVVPLAEPPRTPRSR